MTEDFIEAMVLASLCNRRSELSGRIDVMMTILRDAANTRRRLLGGRR